MKRISRKKTGIKLAMMFVVAVMVLFTVPNLVFADVAGQNSPTVAVGNWSNPSNSLVSDNLYAAGPSLGLTVKGYGFSIPESATINGIEVRVERKFSRTTTYGHIYDQIACLVLNGTPTWEQSAIYPDYNRAVIWTEWARLSEEIKLFGGPNDTWGVPLTPADVNNPNFGFNIWAMKQGSGTSLALVDHVGITVYYTMPVSDTTPPVITLNGTDPINLIVGDPYTELGATWIDDIDGTGPAVVSGDAVNTAAAGTYTVRYNYTDAALNAATEATRTVNVSVPADTTLPVIDPFSDITVNATSAAGAVVNFSSTATDNADPSVTVICTPASGSTFPAGTTLVTANASDIAGNAAIPVTFNVIVNTFTPPPGGGGITPPPAPSGGGAPSGISVLGITNGGSITDFVTRMYRTILLREPDPEGLAGWVDGLTNGDLEGSDVARGFVFSEEYKEYMASLDDSGYLNFLYNRFFGRPADIDGLNGWLVNLSEGMSRERVLNYFLDCEEWNMICDSYGVTP